METLDPELARIFAAKEARRRRLAALPYPEKVRIVVALQRMVAPVLRARGMQVIVWEMDPEPPASGAVEPMKTSLYSQ